MGPSACPMKKLKACSENADALALGASSGRIVRQFLTESLLLSFIGAGTPPNIPSWGNIMAEGRSLFQVAYYIVLFPGIMLSVTAGKPEITRE